MVAVYQQLSKPVHRLRRKLSHSAPAVFDGIKQKA
jgi:hypothetical protein